MSAAEAHSAAALWQHWGQAGPAGGRTPLCSLVHMQGTAEKDNWRNTFVKSWWELHEELNSWTKWICGCCPWRLCWHNRSKQAVVQTSPRGWAPHLTASKPLYGKLQFFSQLLQYIYILIICNFFVTETGENTHLCNIFCEMKCTLLHFCRATDKWQEAQLRPDLSCMLIPDGATRALLCPDRGGEEYFWVRKGFPCRCRDLRSRCEEFINKSWVLEMGARKKPTGLK